MAQRSRNYKVAYTARIATVEFGYPRLFSSLNPSFASKLCRLTTHGRQSSAGCRLRAAASPSEASNRSRPQSGVAATRTVGSVRDHPQSGSIARARQIKASSVGRRWSVS